MGKLGWKKKNGFTYICSIHPSSHMARRRVLRWIKGEEPSMRLKGG